MPQGQTLHCCMGNCQSKLGRKTVFAMKHLDVLQGPLGCANLDSKSPLWEKSRCLWDCCPTPPPQNGIAFKQYKILKAVFFLEGYKYYHNHENMWATTFLCEQGKNTDPPLLSETLQMQNEIG